MDLKETEMRSIQVTSNGGITDTCISIQALSLLSLADARVDSQLGYVRKFPVTRENVVVFIGFINPSNANATFVQRTRMSF